MPKNKTRIITESDNFQIQPEDIDASGHLWDAFNNSETEVSAGWIVRFLQKNGKGWVPFTYEEINTFYAKKHKDGFTFNRLVEPEMVPKDSFKEFSGEYTPKVPRGGGWIILGKDGKYRATLDFIIRCFKASPKIRQTA